MEKTQRRVAVIGGVRIPFCRNNTAYADVGNFGMSVKVLGALVERFGLHGVELGEVALGAVIKHSLDWNLAREALLSSGLAPTTPGITTPRACGTSLDNTIIVANKIACGQIEAGIAAGSDTTSDVPIVMVTARNDTHDIAGKAAGGVAALFATRAEAIVSRRGRAAHRQVDGRALRADGTRVAHHA